MGQDDWEDVITSSEFGSPDDFGVPPEIASVAHHAVNVALTGGDARNLMAALIDAEGGENEALRVLAVSALSEAYTTSRKLALADERESYVPPERLCPTCDTVCSECADEDDWVILQATT